MPTTRIASVEISDSVRSNVGSKHGLSIDDVIAVATSRTTLREWDDSPTHGRRLLITGYTPSTTHPGRPVPHRYRRRLPTRHGLCHQTEVGGS